MKDNVIEKLTVGFVAVLMWLSLQFSTVASGWGAEPMVYIFFTVTILFSCFGILYIKLNGQITLTSLDIGLIFFSFYMFCRQATLGFDRLQNDLILSFTVLSLFYVYCRAGVRTNNVTDAISVIIVSSGCIEFLIATYQLVGNIYFERTNDIEGSFANANTLCAFLSISLPFVYRLLIRQKQIPAKYAPFLTGCLRGVVIAFLALILILGSRGAIVAAILTVLIFYIPSFKTAWHRNPPLKKWILAIAVLQGFIYAFYLMIEKRDSASGREFVWLRCWDMIKEKPLLGYGWGGFEQQYMLFQERFFSNNSGGFYKMLADDVVYPFNIFLEVAIGMGVIGLILFLCIIVLTFFKNARPASMELTSMAALTTFLVNGFFSYTLHSIPILLIVVFSLSVLSRTTKPMVTFKGIYLLSIPVLGIALLTYCGGQLTAHLHWKRGVENILTDEDIGLEEYEQAYKGIKHRGTFLYNYGTTLFELRKYRESKKVLAQAAEFMNTTYLQVYRAKAEEALDSMVIAEQFYINAVNMNPKLFYPRYYLLQLYIKVGNRRKATKVATQITELEEKVRTQHTLAIKEFANNYLNGKNPGDLNL